MQLFGEKEDTLAWKTSQDGDFSIASAYKSAKTEDTNLQSFLGKWLWKLDTLPKIKHFLWLCFHQSVPVRQVLNARGILCNTCCPLCQNQEESIIHLLHDCPFALRFWNKIGTPQSFTYFLQLDLLEWIKQNCLCNIRVQANGIPWNSQFPFAIWGLWKHKNRVVFENFVSNLNLHVTCIHLAKEYFFCVGKGQQLKHHLVTPIRWHKPEQGWFKLNFDGASQGNPRKAGGGGLI